MQSLIAFLKKLKLRQILTVVLAAVVLLVNTACSTGDVTGARPNNPAVQAGGNNNPHKAGGDGYTNYKMSTDPKAGASLQLLSDRVVAIELNETTYDTYPANPDKLIYPGNEPQEAPQYNASGEKVRERQAVEIPSKGQGTFNTLDPDAKLLERTGAAIKDASGFLEQTVDDSDEAASVKKIPTGRGVLDKVLD